MDYHLNGGKLKTGMPVYIRKDNIFQVIGQYIDVPKSVKGGHYYITNHFAKLPYWKRIKKRNLLFISQSFVSLTISEYENTFQNKNCKVYTNKTWY